MPQLPRNLSSCENWELKPGMLSWEDQLDICSMIAAQTAIKSGLQYDDLFSEAVGKLPRIYHNYIPEHKKSFTGYLKICLRGYLKNYIRDRSFIIRIPRRIVDCYSRTFRYSSPEVAAQQTQYTREEIIVAQDQVKTLRPYKAESYEDWNTDVDLLTEENAFFASEQILEEAGINFELLNDYYVNEQSEYYLRKHYGEDYELKIKNQTATIKDICEAQALS